MAAPGLDFFRRAGLELRAASPEQRDGRLHRNRDDAAALVERHSVRRSDGNCDVRALKDARVGQLLRAVADSGGAALVQTALHGGGVGPLPGRVDDGFQMQKHGHQMKADEQQYNHCRHHKGGFNHRLPLLMLSASPRRAGVYNAVHGPVALSMRAQPVADPESEIAPGSKSAKAYLIVTTMRRKPSCP